MLVRIIANSEDPDQTASSEQSDLGLHCLYRPFCQAISAQNYRTFTIPYLYVFWSRNNFHLLNLI